MNDLQFSHGVDVNGGEKQESDCGTSVATVVDVDAMLKMIDEEFHVIQGALKKWNTVVHEV